MSSPMGFRSRSCVWMHSSQNGASTSPGTKSVCRLPLRLPVRRKSLEMRSVRRVSRPHFKQ